MHSIEDVQQLARARGLRIRIESGYVVEDELFTLLDARDLPTDLCDVPLRMIADRLAQPRDWPMQQPAWRALVAAPKPARKRYVPPRSPHWIALQCEALRRFNASGPPFSRTDFAKSLESRCRTKLGYSPTYVEIRRRVRVWLETWQAVRAAERTVQARPTDLQQIEA